MGRPVNQLLRELHEELSKSGVFNVYLIIENLAHGSATMQVQTANRELSQEERVSFSDLPDRIVPIIVERTKRFKD